MFYGWGSKNIDLGALQTHHCTVCAGPRTYRLICQYGYFGVMFLLNFVTRKEYLSLCEVCWRGYKLNNKEVESRLGRSPIPFFDQYGFLLGVVTFLIFGVVSRFI